MASDTAVKSHHKHMRKEQKSESAIAYIIRNKWLYIFLIPGVVYIFIFRYIPIFWNIIAFYDYNIADGIAGIFTSEWVGFKHFEYIFTESLDFWKVFRNTILLNLYRLVLGFPAPILLALLLNEVRKTWYKKVTQTVVYLPYFISWVVVAGMVQFLLSPSGGAINELLKQIGLEPIAFLQKREWFRTIIVGVTIYKEVGYASIIYLAALAGINGELYESALIDGAKRLQMVRYITLPGILPTIIVILILNVGSIISGGFTPVLLLYNPLVYEVGDIIGTYVYRTGIQQGRFSYSTAIGLFESAIAIVLILVTNKLAKKYGEGGLW